MLELFSEERPWLRVGDVAGRLGVSDSTASRLLARLEARGYVERHPASGLFALGPRILTMAGVAMNHSDLRRAGLEEMHRLVHTLGLGANLAVLRDGGVFYLGNLDGRHAPRYYTLLGRRYPLHATALGKVLLAWRDAAEGRVLRACWTRPGRPGPLQRYTPSTVADLPGLLARLEGVRTRGYATEVEELAMGRACVAAPIRGPPRGGDRRAERLRLGADHGPPGAGARAGGRRGGRRDARLRAPGLRHGPDGGARRCRPRSRTGRRPRQRAAAERASVTGTETERPVRSGRWRSGAADRARGAVPVAVGPAAGAGGAGAGACGASSGGWSTPSGARPCSSS